jgi:hypothetical protein
MCNVKLREAGNDVFVSETLNYVIIPVWNSVIIRGMRTEGCNYPVTSATVYSLQFPCIKDLLKLSV